MLLDGPNILDSYSGGPGSVAGVGRTVIRMSPEQRTGKNNDKLAQSGFFTESGRPSKVNPNIKFKDLRKRVCNMYLNILEVLKG